MGLLPTAAVVVLLGVALAPAARAQSKTLLSEDFEGGLGGWTTWPAGSPTWHLAPHGECGAISAMAACNNGAASCNHTFVGATKTGRMLESPEFPLGTGGPWIIEFDYRKSMDSSDVAWLDLLSDSGDGIFASVAGPLPDSDGVTHVSVVLPLDQWWWGQGGTLQFGITIDPAGNSGFGLMIDNVRVTNLQTWTDLGKAKPGSAGTPVLEGHGSLAPGEDNTLALTNAAPSSLATLVAGLTDLYWSFKGGTLVPKPQFLVPLPTSPTGEVLLQFVMPPGTPPNFDLYTQFWIQDAGASHGFSASNALYALWD
jgi:hypothetical protein